MKPMACLIPLASLLALAGCNGSSAWSNSADDGAGGRYSGVGIYPADTLWKEVQGAPDASDESQARLGDDAQIIVVVDRVTGEIRQCGNKSGFCVAMNPWSGGASKAMPSLPARLAKHAEDLEPAAVNAAENAATP